MIDPSACSPSLPQRSQYLTLLSLPTAVILGWPEDRGCAAEDQQCVLVNGIEAQNTDHEFHQWEGKLTGLKPGPLTFTACAEDEAGNVEQLAHTITVVAE